jgi:two-component system OmpR family response regulator
MPTVVKSTDWTPGPVPAPPRNRGERRVLLIEDEQALAANIAERLEEAGWSAQTVADGALGLRLALEGRFDVIVVDRMLPSLDGLSLVADLRVRGVETPVLFVTAMGSVADRVAGLEGGGDDYLVKPFSFEELRARLGILARRGKTIDAEATVLRARDLTLDRLRRSVVRGDRAVDLLPLEYKLLEFLLLHQGQTVTRSMLLQRVWGFKFDPRTNIVETHISRLRGKIDPSGAAPLIVTVRGAGYLIPED